MKYSMFIGRWQPWHKGHRWLIDQRLNQNKNVLICIRDMKTDYFDIKGEVFVNFYKDKRTVIEVSPSSDYNCDPEFKVFYE